MPSHAVMARQVNAGKLEDFDLWKPYTGSYEWMLIGGATSPPRGVCFTEKRSVGGDSREVHFLNGVTLDLSNMEGFVLNVVEGAVFDVLRSFRLTKEQVLAEVEAFFMDCKQNVATPVLYYSGHGEKGTGNWCFKNGCVSPQDVERIHGSVAGCRYPMIISDSCYSGFWADYLSLKKGYHCLAASPYHSVAYDTRDGGSFTLWMTGKASEPRTEPVYTHYNKSSDLLRNVAEQNILKTTLYGDILSSHLNVKNSSDSMLISQTMCGDYFSAIFAPHKRFTPRPTSQWWRVQSHEGVVKYHERLRGEGLAIYSLTAWGGRFGVFSVAGFGTEQVLAWGGADSLSQQLQMNFAAGYRVTSCCADGPMFYCVMTKGAEGFEGKAQMIIRRNSWATAVEEIEKQFKEGKRVTSACFNQSLEQYMIVMTVGDYAQSLSWFDSELRKEGEFLDEKQGKGLPLHPTLVLKVPKVFKKEDLLLVVSSDKHREKKYILTGSSWGGIA